MNEGRMFLYISPNVALPFLFLILILTSLTVHFSLLNNTTWFSAFWQGSAVEATVAPAVEAAPTVAEPAAAATETEAVPAE